MVGDGLARCDTAEIKPIYDVWGLAEEEHVAWFFVPICSPQCETPQGKEGNRESVILKVTTCNETQLKVNFDRKCEDTVTYVLEKTGATPSDDIRYYGDEVCVGIETTKSKKYWIMESEYSYSPVRKDAPGYPMIKCEGFCLSDVNHMKEIILSESQYYEYGYAEVEDEVTIQKTTKIFELLNHECFYNLPTM